MWPLQGAFPLKVPLEPAPRRVLEGSHPLTWITVSSPSWGRSAVSPSAGSLEGELIAAGAQDPRESGSSQGVSSWDPGQDLLQLWAHTCCSTCSSVLGSQLPLWVGTLWTTEA